MITEQLKELGFFHANLGVPTTQFHVSARKEGVPYYGVVQAHRLVP